MDILNQNIKRVILLEPEGLSGPGSQKLPIAEMRAQNQGPPFAGKNLLPKGKPLDVLDPIHAEYSLYEHAQALTFRPPIQQPP